MTFIELEVVARDGIEPSTRGFSVQRRDRFGGSKPKIGEEFSTGRPNRPPLPSPYRTGTPKIRPNSRGPDPVQRPASIATEPFPNCAPGGAPLTETLRPHALLQPRAHAPGFGREPAGTFGQGRCRHPFSHVAEPLPRALSAAVCGLTINSHPTGIVTSSVRRLCESTDSSSPSAVHAPCARQRP